MTQTVFCTNCNHEVKYHIRGGCVKIIGSHASAHWPGEREAILCGCQCEIEAEASADPYPAERCAICVTQGKAWCPRHAHFSLSSEAEAKAGAQTEKADAPGECHHHRITKECYECSEPLAAVARRTAERGFETQDMTEAILAALRFEVLECARTAGLCTYGRDAARVLRRWAGEEEK